MDSMHLNVSCASGSGKHRYRANVLTMNVANTHDVDLLVLLHS